MFKRDHQNKVLPNIIFKKLNLELQCNVSAKVLQNIHRSHILKLESKKLF